MKVKPVLGDWEIPNIVFIRSAEQRQLVELPIPGKTGSLLQDMSSAPTRIVIGGSLYGDEKRDEFLETVRAHFKEGKPLTFVADIVTATEVQYVVIQTLRFEERGTNPDETSFYIELAESPPPPPPPDPLGALDSSLLDEAGGFLDSVTGALDAIDAIGSIPELKDPTPPLKGTLDGVKSALDGLGGIQDKLTALFGPGA
jgi:hypothetical protein